YRDLLGQVAIGYRRCNIRNVTHLGGKITGHEVYIVRQVLPGTRDSLHLCLTAKLSFRTYFAGHTSYFRRERAKLVDHRVDDFTCSQELAFERASINFERHTLREISLCYAADNARHFGQRLCEIADKGVHAIDRDGPCTGGVRQCRTLSDLSFFTDDRTRTLQLTDETLVHLDNFVQLLRDAIGQRVGH